MPPEYAIRIGPPHAVASTAFIAPNATLTGDVSIEDEASVWFGVVLRADVGPIVIGRRSNVQDGTIMHADTGLPCAIGEDVTVGHGAIVHGARIGDRCLIGMGAIVLNGAVIGEGSIIGAGALVREGAVIPPNSLVFGMPGKVVRTVTPEQAEGVRAAAATYVALAAEYRAKYGLMRG